MSSRPEPFLRANRAAFVALAAALVLAGVVWFALPHSRTVTSVWVLLFKLTPFAAAVACVACIDLDWARRLRLHLVALPAFFLAVFCFFVPKIFFYALQPNRAGWHELYYHVLTLVPFLIVGLVLAFRLGGGSSEGVLRLGAALLLLQLSGIEDLAFLKLNHYPVPHRWTWASHMSVFLGHAPTRNEAYAFIAVHVVLALLVLFLPAGVATAAIRRVGRQWPGRVGAARTSPR
jgi:hypothetical protein